MKPSENLKNAIKKELNFTAGADLHDRILKDVLNAQEKSKRTQAASTEPNIRRQKMFDRSRAWKVAAVLAIVTGAGALATTVGLKVRKYYLVDRESDGTYMFQSEPETVDLGDGRTVTGSRTSIVKVDPNQTIDVDQKIRDLEEIDLLRQQDDRELVSVIEKEVNGNLWSRSLMFKYVLSDGRQVTRGDPDPDLEKKLLTDAQQEELINLMRSDKEEDIRFTEKQVRDRMFSFECHKYVLSDGTEVIWSRGTPKDDP